jgi:hypothetical protein
VKEIMSELLFVLVTVYVAYVVYTSVNDKSSGGPVSSGPAPSVVKSEPATSAAEPNTPAINAVEKEVVSTVATEATNSNEELKNPKTGEVSKVPNNYRFGKRWIKEALVSEGLLDKVYKNNELDNAATSEKVDAAIAKLRTMKKYQV